VQARILLRLRYAPAPQNARSPTLIAQCPGLTARCPALIAPRHTDVFQCYLDHLAEVIPPEPGKRRVLIIDNASWHKAARLNWHHFECKFLPGYSPDFNPIERFWLRLKADYFSDFIARTPDELTERLCIALNAFMDDTKKVAAQCASRK
jgi:DDE superfamily endonuclease